MTNCEHEWRRGLDGAYCCQVCMQPLYVDSMLRENAALRTRAEKAEAQLQGQGTGLTALQLILGPTPNGIVAAVSELRAEVERLRAELARTTSR